MKRPFHRLAAAIAGLAVASAFAQKTELLVYTALFPLLGFGPATFLLLVALLRFGRIGWGRAAGISAAFVVAALVAGKSLNIPLPVGTLFS